MAFQPAMCLSLPESGLALLQTTSMHLEETVRKVAVRPAAEGHHPIVAHPAEEVPAEAAVALAAAEEEAAEAAALEEELQVKAAFHHNHLPLSLFILIISLMNN
jgi:hypothetical protein